MDAVHELSQLYDALEANTAAHVDARKARDFHAHKQSIDERARLLTRARELNAADDLRRRLQDADEDIQYAIERRNARMLMNVQAVQRRLRELLNEVEYGNGNP